MANEPKLLLDGDTAAVELSLGVILDNLIEEAREKGLTPDEIEDAFSVALAGMDD